MAFLKYEISVVGVDKVRAAMRAVEREAEGAGRRSILRDPSGMGRSRASGLAANANASAREAEALYRAKELAAARAARKTETEATKRARKEEALATKQARTAEREHAKSERQKTRDTEREVRARARAEQALNRQRSSALYAQHRAGERAQERAAADKLRGRAEWARATRGVFAGTASSVASLGKGAIAATGLGAGAIFAASAHSSMQKTALATDLANQLEARSATKESIAGRKQSILATVGATRGFSAPEVMAGMSAFQARAGEADATMKMAPVMTEMALASGASIEDLGAMYSSIYAAIRNGAGGAAKSVDQIIAETEKMGRSFTAMGQIGSIELKDFAKLGPEIAAAAISYEGDQSANIRSMAALAQNAMLGGASSPEEAATSVGRFADDLIEHSDKINAFLGEKGSKKIYANKEKTKLRSLPELLPEIMAATGGNLEKMGDVFNVRSMRAVKGFTNTYQDAYQKAKAAKRTDKEAREEGKKAVRAQLDRFQSLEVAPAEQKVKADARMADADKLLAAEMRKLSDAVGSKLLPQITAMIPAISNLVPIFTRAAEEFVRAIQFISESPVKAAFAGLGALFALEIAKAGIDKAITAGFAKLFGLATPTAATALPGAATGAPGALASAGATLAGVPLAAAALPAVAVAGLGAMKVGQVHEQTRVEERGAQIAEELKARTMNAGVWETAVAGEEAQKQFRNVYKTTGSGVGGGADLTRIKAQIEDVVSAKLQGTPEERGNKELAAAMSDLTNAIKSAGNMSPSVAINTGNTPTKPSVK